MPRELRAYVCPHRRGHDSARAAAYCQLDRHLHEHAGAFEGCPVGACQMASAILNTQLLLGRST